ncbi:MAG: hypothetical protein U5K69_03440 [Balneolaceae bacterium]|nr:hypothetical protein [Balneolaceae bacterium]
MIEDPRHRAELMGTVQAPALSNDDLSVSEGEFNLFVEGEDDDDIRYMRYRDEAPLGRGRLLFL